MNFSVKIYPTKEIPHDLTWGDIKEKLGTFFDEHKISKQEFNFNLIDYSRNLMGRLIIENISNLKIDSPSEILKFFNDKPISDYNQLELEETPTVIRNSYYRKIEFNNSNNTIVYNIEFGVEHLNDITEQIEENYKKKISDFEWNNLNIAMKMHNYFIELETDFDKNKLDPILFLALILCKEVEGILFFEHNIMENSIPSGFCYIDDLYKFCESRIS